jgi:ABC-type multidrug transport system ATPase subunit
LLVRPAPRLRAEGITAGYGGVPVIRNVTIAVGPGEIVAIIGPNGAGKSTLLKSLVGILRLSSGRITLGEEERGEQDENADHDEGVGEVECGPPPQVEEVGDVAESYAVEQVRRAAADHEPERHRQDRVAST